MIFTGQTGQSWQNRVTKVKKVSKAGFCMVYSESKNCTFLRSGVQKVGVYTKKYITILRI